MSMELTDRILPEDEKAVFEGLLAFNLAHLEDKEPRDLGIYERDGENKIVAGIIGYTHGNWLMIKYLWVKEDLRGQGTGKKLLWEAEKEAEKRNCKYVFLDTFSFQAPDFYKKYGYQQGYQQQFALENYPLTGKRYYYTKSLTHAAE